MRTFYLVILLILVTSCGKRPGFHIEKITIITQNPELLTNWYAENLDFEIAEERVLKRSDLTISLEDNAHANHRDSIKNKYEVHHLPGIYKIGFITNQFDQLIESLESNDVDFVGTVVTDKIKGYRMQVIRDPEGNRIQIFDGGKEKLQPFFLSVIVENIGEQEKWYQLKFQVTEMHNLDDLENEVYHRVLEGDDFLIELIKTSEKRVLEYIDPEHTTGFHELIIHGARGSFEGDHEGNEIVSP